MDNLSKQETLADILNALYHLPDSSHNAFEASIRQIAKKSEFQRSLATHVLTWVVHAKSDLNVDHVQDSFAIQRSKGVDFQGHRPSKDWVLPACAGLVITDTCNESLRLVHESVQEHLERHRILSQDADLEIASTCLAALLVDDDQDVETSLLRYAARHWCSHVDCYGQKVNPETDALILRFLKDSSKLTRAFRYTDETDGRQLEGMAGLHATVYYNLPFWAKSLVDVGVDVNARCRDGQTAVHWAVRYGRREMLRILMHNSADLDLQDESGDTPLHKALMGPTSCGVDMVQDLVDGGARFDIPSSKGLSPMSLAIKYGPTSMAEIFVKNQVDVDAESYEKWSSLRQVFYHGLDMVEGATARRATTDGLLRQAVE